MSELAKAYVQIIPTAEGITDSLKSTLGGPSQEAGEDSGEKFGGGLLNAAAATIAAGAAALGAAVAGTVNAVLNAADATAAYGDEIDKTSQKLGISASFYQEWDAVLQHSGTSMSSMTATFKTLANAAQGASDDQAAAFERLGLSMDQVQAMSTEDLFSAVISGLQSMEEGTERTAIATDLLGRGATELGALLNTSAEDTQAMIDTVNALGGVMSDGAVKACAAYEDSLQDLKTSFSGIKNNLMAEFLPSITEIMDGLTGLMSGDSSAIGLLSQGIQDFCKNLSDAIPQITGIASELLPTIVDVIVTNLPLLVDSAIGIIQTLVSALLDNLPLLIDSAVQIIVSLTEGFIAMLPELISAGVQIVLGLVTGLANALPDLIIAATDMIVSLVETLSDSDSIDQMVETAATLVAAIVTGLVKALPVLVAALPQIISAIVNGITSLLDSIVEVGGNIVSGLLDGILDAVAGIGSWLKAHLVDPIIDGVKSLFGIHSPSTVFAEMGGYLIEGLLNGITGVWGSITDFFGGALDGLTSLISGAWDTISGTASTAWEGVRGIVGSAWDGITSAVGGALNTVSGAVSSAWKGIKSTVSTVGSGIGSNVSAAWGNVKSSISTNLTNAKTVASTAWGAIESTASTVGKAVKSSASAAFSGVKTAMSTNLTAAKTVASSVFSGINSSASGKLSGVKSAASTAMAAVKTAISTNLTAAKNTASSIFSSLKSNATSWGKDICSNIASGIRNAISKVTSAVRNVASTIRSYLHFSEPDIGPLSDFHTYMPDMLSLMAKGIQDNAGVALDAVSGLAEEIAGVMQMDSFDFGGDLSLGTSAVGAAARTAVDGLEASYSSGTAETSPYSRFSDRLDAQFEHLFQVLGEYFPQFANAQMVLDTGVMAGQMAPALNTELGKLAAARRRGR